jgi:hypothetical protein
MQLADIGLGLQGITLLRDPIANNLRQYMYLQLLRLGIEQSDEAAAAAQATIDPSKISSSSDDADAADDYVDDVDVYEEEDDESPDEVLGTEDREYSMHGRGGKGVRFAINDDGGRRQQIDVIMYPADIVSAVRALRLNSLLIPKWLALLYIDIEKTHSSKPIIPLSRQDKVVAQKYTLAHPGDNVEVNALVDGIRLDMLFPDISLNIELDGPAHRYPSRTRYDSERDAFLAQKGYKVRNSEFMLFNTSK